MRGDRKAVALRKESVDRNLEEGQSVDMYEVSLSARRAWIEIFSRTAPRSANWVALRKESVDRNGTVTLTDFLKLLSLSARRAWIEIHHQGDARRPESGRSPQGERG